MTFWWTIISLVGFFLAYEVFLVRLPMRQRETVDWEHVYKMERDVWGQTFEHLDAPTPSSCIHDGHEDGCECRPSGIIVLPPGATYNPFSYPIDRASLERAAAYLTPNEKRLPVIIPLDPKVIKR